MSKNARICSVCVMDDGAAPLEFDGNGQCNCCRDAITRWPHEYFPDAEGERRLEELTRRLKAEGRHRPYDCMVGLSGGVDSAYLAHIMKVRYGLRLLAVHVDAGWNSEAAVSNIERLVRNLDIDLYTQVIEWNEIRDLQLGFLKAGVLNQDIPQDHAFFATLYRLAGQFGIRTFLSGVNFATECVVPPNWGHPSIDGRHILAVHARHGQVDLASYPIMSLWQYLWQTRIKRSLFIEKPLNYMKYRKSEAVVELRKHYGWKDYGTKHSESRFTKFYQDIFLPRKLGFDKRRIHLSSLIVSKQIERDAALDELRQPLIDERQERFDMRYIAKKLQIPVEELASLVSKPVVAHTTYGNDLRLLKGVHALRNALRTTSSVLRNPRPSR